MKCEKKKRKTSSKSVKAKKTSKKSATDSKKTKASKKKSAKMNKRSSDSEKSKKGRKKDKREEEKIYLPMYATFLYNLLTYWQKQFSICHASACGFLITVYSFNIDFVSVCKRNQQIYFIVSYRSLFFLVCESHSIVEY